MRAITRPEVTTLNQNIFATHAPRYWAAGLPCIPLRERNKMPDQNNWSLYGRQMPTEAEQGHWLARYPNGNIGMPFGPASGLCAIDIDTQDKDLEAAIREICGPTPYERVGKKGAGLIYRWDGQKNFKLRDADGGMLCEFLGLGNQMVLPPSIHPDCASCGTKNAAGPAGVSTCCGTPNIVYTSTTDLWDVKDELPCLGEDIECKLRKALDAKGFKVGPGGRSSPINIVPAGERDVQMVRHAGYLARVVLGIDRSANFSLMEAMAHMYHWVEHYTQKVSGDVIDPEKGLAKLLEFLLNDVARGRTLPKSWDAGLTDDLRADPIIAQISELNAGQSWDVERAREWFDARVRETDGSINGAAEALDDLTQLIAKDSQFSSGQAKLVFGYIHERHFRKEGITKRDMMAGLTQAQKNLEDAQAENQADIARAVLEQLQREGEIRYHNGQFWQWQGAHFDKLDHDDLYMHVANNVTDSALVRRNSDYKAVVEVLQKMCKGALAQSDERGINFANGFVGEDLEVVAHDPKFGATFTLPFNYDRDNATRSVKWMEFLHSVWGHEDDFEQRVMALQEMFAVTLFKTATRYQRAFLLFGRAGTGKTVILNVLRSLLPPDAVSELGPQLWGEKFTLTDMIGTAANICGELPENGMITGNIFKEVVEGSPVRTEFKNQDGFVFVPECAQWFASNYLPVSRDSTRGFTRRWLILDFNKPIREEDKIENLAQLLAAEEREAIAAWALEGLRRVLDQRGYTLPTCHDFRLGQMRRINNSVQAFLEDHKQVQLVDGGEIKAQELYDLYGAHIKHYRRGQMVGFERFMQMLEDLDLNIARDVLHDYVVQGVAKTADALGTPA
jgi:P4 family phage/plasmid primase-like protien